MEKLLKFFSLSLRSRILLVETTLLVLFIVAGIHLVGFARVRKVLHLIASNTTVSSNQPDTLNEVVRAVTVACNTLPGSNACLIRALAAKTLLMHFNIQSELVIGVRCLTTMHENMSAHAWVEHEGQIVLGQSRDPSSLKRLGCISF